MESWSYGSEAKGFMYAGESELISHSDSLGSRKVVTDWDLKTPSFDIESPMSVSGRTVIQVRRVENQGFMELDFRNREEVIGKSLSENPIGVPGVPCNRIGNGRISSFLMGPKVFYGEMEESGSGILSCVTDSNSRESLIDLKLGRLSDSRDGKNLKETSFMSSVVSSNTAPAKRARLVHSNNQTPLCQVHGCNLDLSSSKDYHKRHKVCEIHSKAAKVVVNGLEQRFCQQCSRFHLLVEFDEGKRSCRKRLSGHNERRRKHQMDTHYGKFRKLLSTYNGDNPPATSFLPRTCFICPEIYSSGVLREVKYGNSNGCRTVNLEEEPIYNGELRIPNTNRFLFPTSSFPTHTVENLFPGLQEINSTGGSLCCETSNQYVRTFLNQNSSFNASSSIEGLSGVSNPGCALSLLSSQSWDPSTQSSGLPVAQPLMVQGGHPHYNTGLFPEKLLELAGSSQASTSVGSTRFSSSGMNSVGDDQLGPMLVSDASDAIDLEVKADGLFQNSNLANTKDVISQKGEHTLDLLHLSSQLQNVENHPRQAKLGNEIFLWNLVAQ